MSDVFDTGRVIVFNGMAYPLLCNVSWEIESSGDVSIKARIPFPEQYPQTPLKSAILDKDEDTFILLNIVKSSDSNLYIDYFKILVNDPEYRKLASPEEIRPMKGLGKVVMCNVMKNYVKRILPDINSDSVVELIAAPLFDTCNSYQQVFWSFDAPLPDLIKKLEGKGALLEKVVGRIVNDNNPTPFLSLNLSMYKRYEGGDEILYSFIKKTSEKIPRNIDKKYIMKLLCEHDLLQSLMKYYETYGFVQTNPFTGEMEARFGDIISACSSV